MCNLSKNKYYVVILRCIYFQVKFSMIMLMRTFTTVTGVLFLCLSLVRSLYIIILAYYLFAYLVGLQFYGSILQVFVIELYYLLIRITTVDS